VVRIIVLLELNGVETVPSQGRGRWKLLRELRQFVFYHHLVHKAKLRIIPLTTTCVLLDGVVLVDLHLDPAPWSKLRDDDTLCYFPVVVGIFFALEPVVECMQVGSGNDVSEMGGLR
jgi:hypothetical protein